MDQRRINNYNDYRAFLDADRKALGITKLPPWGGTRYRIWEFEKLLRKCEYFENCKKHWIYKPYKLYLKYKFRQLSVKYGFEIPLNCFGKGLSIAHLGPIVINGATKIGDYCRIHVCVNIGTAMGFSDHAPTIGNNVYIAPGVKIFGRISIADNVVIGANAVVNRGFDRPNITIAGVPARIVKYHNC